MEGKRKPSKPKVASFTDAWIETLQRYNNNSKSQVASFTDAWIETLGSAVIICGTPMSHPLRMRGLKQSLTFPSMAMPGRILYGCVD